MEGALENSVVTTQFTANPRVRTTCGETLPNGTIVDLVAIADQERLGLLVWDTKEKSFISPAIERGGILYYPPDLHQSIREAMIFPNGVAEYGTVAKLFAKISSLYREHLELPEDLAAFATCWSLSSWVPELLLVPPTLCIIGARLHQIHRLFWLFGSLCRRALPVVELSRRLPFFLHPTLMVNDSMLAGKARAFWHAASQGMFVAGPCGTIRELTCSKAIVLQPGDSPQAWGEEAMFLTLPYTELHSLSHQTFTGIAAEFQPQLEMFRLRLMSGVDPFISTSHPLAKFELARNLGACIPEDPGIVQVLTPLLESQQQDVLAQHLRDPRVAILEAVWIPSHELDELTVAEITRRVNALLRSRGESQDYNCKEIGWKLRNLYLRTSNRGNCKALRFSTAIRDRIHEGIREFRLQLPFKKDCPDCRAMQAAGDKVVS